MKAKASIILFLTLCYLSTFGQKENAKPLTFGFYEIHVFTGLTKNGTHILKMNDNGLIVRKVNIHRYSNDKTEIINYLDIEEKELKDFRRNYKALLKFLNKFNYKTYQPLKENKEIQIINGDTLTKEQIIPTSDLGTRILFIDNDYESNLIRYSYCDEQLDELIEKINKVIPKKFRSEYEFRKRCN